MISLSYGGHFDEELLMQHLRDTGRDFIIQGQQAAKAGQFHLSLREHPVP